jgi:glutamine amidotransferase
MITIVDYGMGNLGSIKNMFKYIGVETTIESDVDKIKNASKILLPGVGSFDTAMKKINESDLKEVLNEKALKEQVPVLGICLGMQLLTKSSEEGSISGLIKILYPNGEVNKEEVEEILRYALEGRRRVKENWWYGILCC